jgi:hypothetical protein
MTRDSFILTLAVLLLKLFRNLKSRANNTTKAPAGIFPLQ